MKEGELTSMESEEFLRTIKTCRRRLNMAACLKKLLSALDIGVLAGIVFQAVSFVLPFYYANLYAGLAIGLAILTALALAAVKRSTMREAALVMDGFGFEERIITAYEHLGQEGTVMELQRQDAMRSLQNNRAKIRIAVCPSRKKILFTAGLLVVMLVLAAAPSAVKDRARELHQIRQEATTKEQEIAELVKELQDLEQQQEQEELTEEQMAALQELVESLQASMAEYQQADSRETLEAAGQKLNYKYENMSDRLSELAESLQDGAAVSGVTAESLQAMAEKLREMSGTSGSETGLASNNLGQSGNASGNYKSGGQGNTSSGNGENGGQGNGENGSQGDGQGDGDGSGNGDGNGSGSGEGSGNGSSQGSGSGSGSGRGTGSSDASHDYVSVPNAIADSGNLTGDATNHDTSQYFQAPNGLTWEGTHISHEEVIGSYEENAYEGIAAGRYPSGMENVIKNYFSSFN
jgi:phage host-nuclease inhibitor protein Gam